MSTSVIKEKLSITTHVLDTSRGRPADDLFVCLYKFENNKWIFLKERYVLHCLIYFYIYINVLFVRISFEKGKHALHVYICIIYIYTYTELACMHIKILYI